MDQISMPIRILLAGALAFLALWMVALKPKAAAEAPPAPAPAAVQPVAEPATTEPVPAEPVAEPAQTAVPAPSQPKARPAAAPGPITVVALVGTGVDDAVARELVADLDGARTRIVPIEEIGRHRDLVGGVEIRQTPTILVIGADRRAQRIEGLPDAAQLARAVQAAR